MIGAIIGDILGSKYEFNPTNNYDFELFTEDMNFTDDTICTIAIADAYMNGREYWEALHDWCNRYPNPMGGYGGRFAQWVHSENPVAYNSLGNGSAMRVASLGWLCEEHDALVQAAASAACTHNHPEGIKGAMFVVDMIQKLHKASIDHQTLPSFAAHDWYGYECLPLVAYRNRFDETCPGTIPAACACIFEANDFESSVRYAVSLGADADTLGAIVGGIAEAIWGVPKWMKEKALTYLPDDMKAIYNQFKELTNTK